MTGFARDVVILSTADWDNPFWTNKQHMALKLAERGHRVLYMDSLGLRRPQATGRDIARLKRRLGRGLAGARWVRPDLWVISPVALPLHGSAAADAVNRRLVALQMRAATKRLGFCKPTVLVYNPMTVDWLDALLPSQVVYHAVDDLAAIPGVPGQAIHLSEERLCQRADRAFTTSPALQARLAAWAPDRSHMLPNVVDYPHFASGGAEPADLTAIPHPRIGFVGALVDYKVDFALIEAVARARPEWHWILIGAVGEGQPDSLIPAWGALRNLHLLGPRPYATLPAYLANIDVAVLPMRRNSYTEAMFPMKFFEYLAAGRPVVSTPLPALAAFGDLCRTAEEAAAFTDAITRILEGDRPDPTSCAAAARRHSWNWRLDEMERLLGETP
ncbi:MAG TPA: glycosyltransferase [Patescibacteria group bacterium]|nr:glycosyltransferase [Patescibacteria group bacterium]